MKVNELILKRKSCRDFLDKEVDDEMIYTIIESARWAPSGKNGQPWRFVIIKDMETKNKISKLSIYGEWMKNAYVFIVVYLDKKSSYSYKKDNQGVGAAIENICLQSVSMGLGTCWIGEILEKEQQVNDILGVPSNYELMAVVCLGYKRKEEEQTARLALEDIIYKII